jgi:hypothetical protein
MSRGPDRRHGQTRSDAKSPVLDRTWSDPPGLSAGSPRSTTRPSAARFMLTTFGFFVAGGVLAVC